MRVQLALNVPDIDAAVDHYSKMFGTQPHKRRAGYANFAVAEPPLKLVLFENPDAGAHLHHIGVEVLEADGVRATQDRFQATGMLDKVEEETKCCHATQHKVWSRAYNGLRWEWYHIVDDAPDPGDDTLDVTCCVGAAKSASIGAG